MLRFTRRLIPLFVLSLLVFACHDKNVNKQESNFKFPEDWYGDYEGELELWNAEKGNHMTLPMVLKISKTDDENRIHWYSSSEYMGKEVVKDYHIVMHDSLPKNHFVMDENNGILLDRVLLDNAFYDYFEVSGTGLYGITKRVQEGILFEIASFRLNSVSHSFYKGNEFDVDTVSSFKVANTQKVLLRPTK